MSSDIQNANFLYLTIIKSNREDFDMIDWSDEINALNILKKNNVMDQSHDAIENDREFMIRAVKETRGHIFRYAPDAFKSDEEIALIAIEVFDWTLAAYFSSSILQYVSSELRSNKNLILKAVEKSGLELQYASDNLKDDIDVVLKAVKQNDSSLQYASNKLKNNEEFKRRAVIQSHLFIIKLPESYKDNKEFALHVLKKNKFIFSFLSEKLKADEDIVLSILPEHVGYLEFASMQLRGNINFMLKAVKLNGLSLLYASDNLKTDKTLLSECLQSQCNRQATHVDVRTRLAEKCQHLLEGSYIEPNETEIELLKQIKLGTRLGRLNLKCSDVQSQENRQYKPSESFDMCSSEPANLGSDIQEYFGGEPAFFEYSLFYPKEATKVNGIIINYYGGYCGPDFITNTQNIFLSDAMFLNEGYIVIHLATHDNWQTIPLWEQTNKENTEGIKLLNKTLMQLSLFTQSVKKRFPDMPVIYHGASFGGFKGALMNVLLSNKENLDANGELKNFIDSEIFKKMPTNLFDGYILHDGAYDRINMLTDIKSVMVDNPTLILHNFDDERVSLSEALKFIMAQLGNAANSAQVQLHMTPQGAPTAVQVPDIGGGTSLQGHFSPEPIVYSDAYKKAIKNFLTDIHTKQHAFKSLTQQSLLTKFRYMQTQALYDSGNITTTRLYRIYHALLNNEPKPIDLKNQSKAMIKRIQKAISMMTYDSKNPDKKQEFNLLIHTFGPWLIAQLQSKYSLEMKYLLGQAKDKKKRPGGDEKPAFFLPQETTRLQQPTEQLHFVLTENAFNFLRKLSSDISLDIIKRSRQFAIYIDENTLEYFSKHSSVNNIDEFMMLWQLKKKLDITIDLNVASRTMSLMKRFYHDEDTQVKVLECIQKYSPVSVISTIMKKNFNISEIEHLMEKLLEQPKDIQSDFLCQIGKICDYRSSKKIMIDWLCRLKPEKRNLCINNYFILRGTLKNNENMLATIRENPHLLEEIITEKVESLDKIIATIKHLEEEKKAMKAM